MDAQQAARNYQAAVVSASQYKEAAAVASESADQARATLASVDPTHALLQLSPTEMMDATAGLSLHPLQMLVELFLKPQPPREAMGVSPSTALLAGSLAMDRSGSAGTSEILRRVVALTRMPMELRR